MDQPDSNDVSLSPCRRYELPARLFKALIQMLLGAGAFVVLTVQLVRALVGGQTMVQVHQQVFELMALTLVLAAAVELAHTLYTRGASNVLDPLALGVSAALLLQLGGVEAFDARHGVAVAMYVAALVGLFVIRKHLSAPRPSNEETIRDGWQRFQWWRQKGPQAPRRGFGRSRAKAGKHLISRVPAPTFAPVEPAGRAEDGPHTAAAAGLGEADHRVANGV